MSSLFLLPSPLTTLSPHFPYHSYSSLSPKPLNRHSQSHSHSLSLFIHCLQRSSNTNYAAYAVKKHDVVEEEEEEEEEGNDDFIWIFQDNDEFAEPANPDSGQQKQDLLASDLLRPANRTTSGDGEKFEGYEDFKKYPKLAAVCQVKNTWLPMLDYLTTFGLNESDFVKLQRRKKYFFAVSVLVARKRLTYLLDLGVQPKGIRRILLRQAAILSYSEENMKAHVAFLLDLGIPKSKLGKVITDEPSIMSLSIEDSLKPALRYLIEEVGIAESDIAKVVTSRPRVLVQRIDYSWDDFRYCLTTELGARQHTIAKIVTKFPWLLLGKREAELLPKIRFLKSIGLDNKSIRKISMRIPQIYSLTLDNIKAKYWYLVHELKHDAQSLKKYPMYLTMSLHHRIRPRHRFLEFVDNAPDGPFNLRTLLQNDQRFCILTRTNLVEYFKFQQNWRQEEYARKE